MATVKQLMDEGIVVTVDQAEDDYYRWLAKQEGRWCEECKGFNGRHAEGCSKAKAEGMRQDMSKQTSDVPKPVKVLDLTKYKTASGAAKAAYRKLQEYAEYLGQRPDEVFIKTPAENWEGCGGWFVCWEGGPYEWGIKVSGDYDCDDPHQTGGMPVPLKCDPSKRVGWMTEPYWSFSLVFYQD